ncbi:hypothetical protein CR513_42819, partial [Mucuna pruriens]
MAEDKTIILGLNELPNLYIHTTLKGHKKLSHIKGSAPPRDDPKFKDSAACYDIKSKIFNSRQGTLSIIEYYGTLNGLWIELDQYQGLKMCKADSIAHTGLIERGRIFKFLHDLNSKYDPIQVQILGEEKLLSLSESEETHRSVMLDKGRYNTGSTMVTRKGFTK